MGYWKSRVFPTIKKLFEKSPTKKSVAKVCLFLPAVEKSREVEIVEEVVKTDEPFKEEGTPSSEKEIEIVEEKKEEVNPTFVPVPAAAEEKKPAVEEEKKAAIVEDKKLVVEEEKKPAVEEKKPMEEVKKEFVASVQVA
ncbi:PREDICTED: plasma membrane-associated cation-binding protein 2-like [Brassica oleracea var. oleracea]|uniref:plasma membrane-associated cation-binding protein 2-like n=1 Tax=Brassica oleracea var. oleracea TaxID=109376 RepID=UPI0006A73923|nr:PREDICTED: plasma membrane-associated cation-binding protein 2-like [Brassica oleracea var. oleracea]